MAKFKRVVQRKVEGPLIKLTQITKYTMANVRDLIRYCIQLPPSEWYRQTKYHLDNMYGNRNKKLASYRKEIKIWPKFISHDAKSFHRLSNFIWRCQKVFLSYLRNVSPMPSTFFILVSKLHTRVIKVWTRMILKMKGNQQREQNLNDFIRFEEGETFLMSFKRWALGIYQHTSEMNRK